jgi:UDP-2-acetamido-2,6-beta-L-arabino-hexul-4-ose reductase
MEEIVNIVVTGAYGFIGRHLVRRLQGEVTSIGSHTSCEELFEGLETADVLYHLAGVNRPKIDSEFETVNVGFTQAICGFLRAVRRAPKIVMASSVSAALDTPYGISKRRAEETLSRFASESGADVRIHRLRRVFGGGCRPNYNSVVATWCYNVANNIPIQITEPTLEIELTYIDDVVTALIADETIVPFVTLTLADLAACIREVANGDVRNLNLFESRLYATYQGVRNV